MKAEVSEMACSVKKQLVQQCDCQCIRRIICVSCSAKLQTLSISIDREKGQLSPFSIVGVVGSGDTDETTWQLRLE